MKEEDKYSFEMRGQRSQSTFHGDAAAENDWINLVPRKERYNKQGVDTLSKSSHGKHIFLDCTEFFPTSSFDGNDMLELMRLAVDQSDAKEVHAHVELFDGSTSPPGFAAVVLLDESHVSAHCYSDRGLLAIDAFTCGGTDPMSIVEELKQALYELSPTTVLMQQKSVDRFLLPEV